MSWLWDRRVILSEKNGRIDCVRTFGRWDIFVGGAHESTRYLADMWRDALRRLPAFWPAKRVLMLGLAGGTNLALLEKRFPGCRVTAVEWDPQMVRIFREFGLKGMPSPEIIEGDAGEVVKTLEGPYDLIIVDLFTGPKAGGPLSRPGFHAELFRLLAPSGFIFINTYLQPELLSPIVLYIVLWDWRWKFNTLALGSPPLPGGYLPYRQDPGYLDREFGQDGRYRLVGGTGVSWNFGPLRFEKHYGDEEPLPTAGGPKRLVMWQPLARRDVPRGWRRAPADMGTRLTGFVDLAPDYAEHWTPHARRHLKRWGKSGWEIVEVDPEAFLAAYAKARMRPMLKGFFAGLLRSKIAKHGDRVKLFAARASADSSISAGFACLDLPESRQSVHLMSFVLGEGERVSAGTGLVDGWFRHGLAQDFRFMDFDLFWAPGDPKSWRGFSRFKSQFGTRFIMYPSPLFRWK